MKNAGSKRRAVFLDRDGVINENRSDYVKCWQEFAFLPGVFDAIRMLAETDYLIVVVTNQSIIGRHLIDSVIVESIHQQMCGAVHNRGGRIDAVYYCPHSPDDKCSCRKPQPGLILRAAQELNLDLSRSYLIGDALSDVEAALLAGCSPLLVLTGRGSAQRLLLHEKGFDSIPIAHNLVEAVAIIPNVFAQEKNARYPVVH